MSLLNGVPTCLTCPRALRAHVPTCPRALRARVPTCPRALRARVPACLTCPRARVPACLTCPRARAPTCPRARVPTCPRARVPFLACLFLTCIFDVHFWAWCLTAIFDKPFVWHPTYNILYTGHLVGKIYLVRQYYVCFHEGRLCFHECKTITWMSCHLLLLSLMC